MVAGFGVAGRIEGVAVMLLFALSGSIGPFVGQNWGAGDLDRVHGGIRVAYRFSLIWGAAAWLVLMLIGDWVVPLIDDNPAVIDVARHYLAIVPISYGLWGVLMMASASFNSLGKPIPSTIMAFTRMFVVYVPLAMLADHLFGYTGIFVATATANCLMGYGDTSGSNVLCPHRPVAASFRPDALLRYGRRLITVPLYLALTAVATLALPLLAPLCWLVSLRASTRGALRSGAFALVYLWCETIGILASGWLWMRNGLPTRASARWHRFLAGNFALQCWWANALKTAAERLFRLSFAVEGSDALDGAPAIMLPRHASIADTIIPMVFYAAPYQVRLRYVLKRELLLDPCLDIVGNRLPNCFVARSGADAQADIDKVVELTHGRAADEGFLIYPEGTRFSTERRARVLDSLATRVAAMDLQRMQRWTDLLPPRTGGACALIDNAPELDLVFCAHTGFERASHFSTLINGGWLGAHIRIRFWRVARRDIPSDPAAQRELLFTQWDRMQETVAELRGR